MEKAYENNQMKNEFHKTGTRGYGGQGREGKMFKEVGGEVVGKQSWKGKRERKKYAHLYSVLA